MRACGATRTRARTCICALVGCALWAAGMCVDGGAYRPANGSAPVRAGAGAHAPRRDLARRFCMGSAATDLDKRSFARPAQAVDRQACVAAPVIRAGQIAHLTVSLPSRHVRVSQVRSHLLPSPARYARAQFSPSAAAPNGYSASPQLRTQSKRANRAPGSPCGFVPSRLCALVPERFLSLVVTDVRSRASSSLTVQHKMCNLRLISELAFASSLGLIFSSFSSSMIAMLLHSLRPQTMPHHHFSQSTLSALMPSCLRKNSTSSSVICGGPHT